MNIKIRKGIFIRLLFLLAAASFVRFFFYGYLSNENHLVIRLLSIVVIVCSGAFYLLIGSAKIIEETTDVLSKKTKLAGGLLQSFGTALPDMAIGIVAAMVSLKLKYVDFKMAVNFAIIAASTTFGSNIYNIGHALWCVFRQNLANEKNRDILMFPLFKNGGTVRPINKHSMVPSALEFDTAINVITALSALTSLVAVLMVVFGKIDFGFDGDLYQLIQPAGLGIFVISAWVMFIFRKNKRNDIVHTTEDVTEENSLGKLPVVYVLGSLLASGVVILFSAESMVEAVKVLGEITKVPYVVIGAVAGVIGCLGEMIVIHNFSVHPKGRIGDALVGVGMDNIVTVMGASVVSIMGGIFLGGNALIVIFVTILCLNSLLVWQINKLKNFV